MRVLGWNIRGARSVSSAEYASVVVPLEQAHLHSHSARMGHAEFEEDEDAGRGDDEDAAKDGEHESTGMLEMSVAEYSIEGLRKEVRKGGKGQWTDYERE
jgi:hypothetical protein